MNYWMPGNTAVENVRRVAWSALPDAPVEPDSPRPQRWQHTALRARVGAALRASARRRLRMAERLDPSPRCG
ncbi:MAG: hypothetical protein ACRDP9_16810 [Kribbellaceae bacterium]